MTELELQILDNAKEHIPALKIKVRSITPKARYLTFPIRSNHTFDTVTYDTKTQRFTKVTYPYWDGDPNNEVEFKDIDLTNITL